MSHDTDSVLLVFGFICLQLVLQLEVEEDRHQMRG